MTDALYGSTGFFRTNWPADHFRTSVHVSTAFAGALLRLARAAGLSTVVDVGAGRGELVRSLHELAPDLELIAVELAPPPPELPPGVRWVDSMPYDIEALVVANEWLDNVPLDVVEVDATGTPRLVEVCPDASERLGEPVGGDDLAWLDRWWPLTDAVPGVRAEIGRPRDEAWLELVRRLRRGIALAIDYGHFADSRPVTGSLRGYRSGRVVDPAPDGSCDLTADVAIDAVAASGDTAATGGAVLRQRDALAALGLTGLDEGQIVRPDLSLARSNPRAYLTALSRAGEAAELTDPRALGGYWWIVHTRTMDLVPELSGVARSCRGLGEDQEGLTGMTSHSPSAGSELDHEGAATGSSVKSAGYGG
ncbi:MAG TPA: SAM-dependent methyltransferase [Actinopolymorphaceae bacterium]|jgi:hypothetical protein